MSVSHLDRELDPGAECNEPGIATLLEQRDLLGHGQMHSGAYTERDRDRVRMVKALSFHPEGIVRSKLTNTVLKGYRLYPEGGAGYNDIDQNKAVDGSDPDYQFTRRFTEDLEAAELVNLDGCEAGIIVRPTLKLLDLISEGISKIARESAELIYDREFIQNILKTPQHGLPQLSDSQKDTIANALRRYIRRIRDYRLVFEVTFERGGHRSRSNMMTKQYKTRFNSKGRVDRAFARLQSSFEVGFEKADTAVFCTLTTDPKKFDSHYDMIQSINPNFNRLRNLFGTDPDTIMDTREEGVPSWTPDLDSSNFHFGAEGAVSGRPREHLDYIKVLEFTSKGYPHLHVLFFDPPSRESDGMPWLIDKAELSHHWKQAEIVDLYPLTYRDDLDELGNFGTEVAYDESGEVVRDDDGQPVTKPVDEGFVCWYQYGDHDHDSEWIENKTRYHKENGLIDMEGSDDVMQQKTAGAYIGKYISETYGALHSSESLEKNGWDHNQKAAWWKLGMYWATERHFWSVSNGIRDQIRLEDDGHEPEVEKAIRECVFTSLKIHADENINHHPLYPDPDDGAKDTVLRTEIRGTLAHINYLGAYAYYDLPARVIQGQNVEVVERAHYDSGSFAISTGDRPPPEAA